MYEVESTRGYVLNYYNVGESDRRFRLLTPDHGVIQISATSVRKEKSKMRHYLQRFNLVSVDYIQGRIGYKCIGGELIDTMRTSQEGWGVLARVGQMIERLTQSEDEDTELFGVFRDLDVQLKQLGTQGANWEKKYSRIVEQWTNVRVLGAFGYFDTTVLPDISPVFEKHLLSSDDFDLLVKNSHKIERLIDEAMMQTMM